MHVGSTPVIRRSETAPDDRSSGAAIPSRRRLRRLLPAVWHGRTSVRVTQKPREVCAARQRCVSERETLSRGFPLFTSCLEEGFLETRVVGG